MIPLPAVAAHTRQRSVRPALRTKHRARPDNWFHASLFRTNMLDTPVRKPLAPDPNEERHTHSSNRRRNPELVTARTAPAEPIHERFTRTMLFSKRIPLPLDAELRAER